MTVFQRRQILRLFTSAAAAPLTSQVASAQAIHHARCRCSSDLQAGINLLHVPYRGAGPAMVDLMGGQVQVMFNVMSASLQYVRAGKLRAFGVATKTRQAALPDVPTVAEFVPGYEASFWAGVAAPKGLPPEIIDQQSGQCELAGSQGYGPSQRVGATGLAGSPVDFAKFVAEGTEKWGKVIHTANIKAEWPFPQLLLTGIISSTVP